MFSPLHFTINPALELTEDKSESIKMSSEPITGMKYRHCKKSMSNRLPCPFTRREKPGNRNRGIEKGDAPATFYASAPVSYRSSSYRAVWGGSPQIMRGRRRGQRRDL